MEGDEEVELEGEEVEGERDKGEGDGEEEFGKEEDKEEEDGEGDGEGVESLSINFRPFSLPKIWSVNNFLPKLSMKVFNKLHDCFQIPSHIPLRLPSKNEKCDSRRKVDVGFYEFVLVMGLRLPLTALHCQLAEVLWGQISRGHH